MSLSLKNWLAVAVLVSGLGGLSGCAGAKPAAKPSEAAPSPAKSEPAAAEKSPAPAPAEAPAGSGSSLFDRLGGMPAIEAVIADFMGNVAADERINAPFAVSDLKLVQKRLVEFVCVATGGPCKYGGRDMKAAHRGMGVTNAQFDALVGDLVKTLEKFKVPEREKSELLGALGPLREQIVEAE
ncbi:MAG TPA: group 1 truncated hemoglobin [Myxococcaceae bacterium]|jgi:hemoglobin